MARQFLTSIDLAQNEIQNPRAQNLAGHPSSPVKGQFYMNTTDNVLYWWDGAVWQAAKDSGATGFPGYGASVVTETGFGQTSAVGVATTVARADHTHGSPTHDAAAHSTIPLNTFAVPTADVSMNGRKLTFVGSPVASGDAANKGYVDNAVAGFSWKDSVRVATTANITLSGTQTIDGVAVVVGNRVIVKNQTNAAENGIYVVASGAWTRATDANDVSELEGAAAFVEEGTLNADSAWVVTTNGPITIGTTPITWAQFAGTGGAVPPTRQVISGAGLIGGGPLSSDLTLDIVTDASLTVTADLLQRSQLTGDVTAATGSNATTIANDVVTNTKLANMPAVTIKGNNTGAAADPLDLTATQVRVMLGVPRIAAATLPAGTSYAIVHNFNSRNVVVQVYRATTPWDLVEADVELTDANTATIRFNTAISAGAFTATVIGGAS